MKSPFPGMDPFIEGCGIGEDFHHDFISEIKNDLANKVPPQYVVRTGERNYVLLCDAETGKESHSFLPDIGVIAPTPPKVQGRSSATVLLDEPVTDTDSVEVRVLISEEFRESFVEIYSTDPERRLVRSFVNPPPSGELVL